MSDHVEETGAEPLVDETQVDAVGAAVEKVVVQLHHVDLLLGVVVEDLLDPLRHVGEDAALVLCSLHVGGGTAVDLHCVQGSGKLIANQPHRRVLSPAQLAENLVLIGKHLSDLPATDTPLSLHSLDDTLQHSNPSYTPLHRP